MTSWMSHACAADCTLRDVMKVMDATGVPIVLVVDYLTDVLQGTVTDGDIRRWLLKGGNLNATAEDVMQPSPRVEYVDGPNQPLPSWVTLIPQVQYLTRKIVGLKDLRKPQRQNPVVIMAGGLGTRLRPLTDDTPKPMLHVGGKPILQRLVEQFVAQGFGEIYISVGYKADVIEAHFGDGSAYGASIKYLREDQARGTAGALALLPKTHNAVVVANGDVVTDVSFARMVEFHVEHSAAITMAVREYKMKCEYGFVQTEGSRINAIVEKPSVGINVNAGIYVIGREAMKRVPEIPTYSSNADRARRQAVAQCDPERFDMTTLVERCVRADMPVHAFLVLESWLDVGTPETLAQAQRECGE